MPSNTWGDLVVQALASIHPPGCRVECKIFYVCQCSFVVLKVRKCVCSFW